MVVYAKASVPIIFTINNHIKWKRCFWYYYWF